MGRDASIIIKEVKFTYNGTYTCQVKNPPDAHGALGEIRLLVVTTGKQSAHLIKLEVPLVEICSLDLTHPLGEGGGADIAALRNHLVVQPPNLTP